MATSRSQSVLSEETRIILPENKKPADPNQFYQTRKGLNVWYRFEERILPAAQPMEHLPALAIASFPLNKTANQKDIRQELPEGHEFDASELLLHLAGMIERQSDGRPGDLLANGDTNIAYVWGVANWLFAVRVGWSTVRRGWDVNAYELRGNRWNAGSRVLSRTCRRAA